ncbi:MAG: 50S ribosomal protein L3 [Candidatus Roizmanbacteria bacterium GW2011_GWA2_36_23]|uniref:Large ribosomal subunit protein uL3 n=1 Tax=Candidatus Roizmanbacteria bacterium GW2011_GWA2_36_23 TaxID=1618480 RepID=A0A0G0GQS7_9BACT|nr:MAG: 50S ribosomal protein L3 [Candidatus Roizmanbacteria bacterium GW2011_GWA2_36_23]
MTGFILGEKSDQSQTFTKNGERIPITFIKTSQCYLIDMRIISKDGYFSAKLGFGQAKNIKKPMQGELARAGIKTPLRFLREIRLEKFGKSILLLDEPDKKGMIIDDKKIYTGQELKATDVFKIGDLVDISGTSKGKGFQGVVKRHHFAGGPRTHGQSDRERAPGSIGQTTTPGRVYKGKRMAGRMGGERVTIKNLEVVEVREDGIVVKGVVPGAKKGMLEVRSAN